MSLSIQQDEQYLGNNRWRWSVWLNGAPEDLESIDHVVYVLHPTFNNPVRKVSDRNTKFRLDTTGWGTFTVHAIAVHHDGQKTALDHDLVLLYPDGTPTSA